VEIAHRTGRNQKFSRHQVNATVEPISRCELPNWPGDSTKTTILDAIELCLYPRAYFLADDSDFFNLDVEEPIRIIVTLTDLPVGFTASTATAISSGMEREEEAN